MDKLNLVKGVLFGVAIGDALGVPVEFQSREFLKKNPIKSLVGFGSHYQPPGTFSDDASLTFCLAEALTFNFDLKRIAHNFIKWRDNAYWTATGNVFDIGNGTDLAISKLLKGIPPEKPGE